MNPLRVKKKKTLCPLVAIHPTLLIRSTAATIRLGGSTEFLKAHDGGGVIAETMFWNELFVFLKCFATNAHRVTHTETRVRVHTRTRMHTVLPPYIVLYVLSIQMTSEMMNVVVISPLCCTSGRMGNQCESPQRHTYTHMHLLSHTHTR